MGGWVNTFATKNFCAWLLRDVYGCLIEKKATCDVFTYLKIKTELDINTLIMGPIMITFIMCFD